MNICNIVLYEEGDMYENAESLYFNGEIDPNVVGLFPNIRYVFTSLDDNLAFDKDLNEIDYSFNEYTTKFFAENREIITTFMRY